MVFMLCPGWSTLAIHNDDVFSSFLSSFFLIGLGLGLGLAT